jgi:enterochelin esterase-like enzyme
MKKLLPLICTIISLYSHAQKSNIEHFIFYSNSLKEDRELTVYIPANFNSEESYKVIFCTDGQLLNEQYKHKLDSVFTANTVSPFVIVGVNSNEKNAPNSYFEYRHFEYVENHSDNPDLNNRFERHLNFFVNEVDKYIKEELNLKISNQYFYGVSNGAGFGVSLSKYYPNLFSKYILYSIAGENFKKLKWNAKQYPFFIIRYGDKEAEPLIKNNKKLSKYLLRNHYKHIFESYNGGHSRADWLNLFIKDIERL